MKTLTATNHLIRFRLGSSHTTNPVDVYFSGRSISATTITPVNYGVKSNGTSNVTLVSSPASSEQKEALDVSFFNADTTNKQVIVEFYDGTNAFILFKCTLAPDEKLEFKNGWRVFASTGAVKQSINQGANATTSGLSAVVLGSDVTNNNAVANTIADVTGLSFSVLANKTYYFKFVIRYTAAAATTGSRWGVNCTAGLATNLTFTSEYTLTATTSTRNAMVQAFDSPAASNASSIVAVNMCVMEGHFTPTADGTFIARFASEVAASAIVAKAGSVCYYQQTN